MLWTKLDFPAWLFPITDTGMRRWFLLGSIWRSSKYFLVASSPWLHTAIGGDVSMSQPRQFTVCRASILNTLSGTVVSEWFLLIFSIRRLISWLRLHNYRWSTNFNIQNAACKPNCFYGWWGIWVTKQYKNSSVSSLQLREGVPFSILLFSSYLQQWVLTKEDESSSHGIWP